MSNSFDHAQGLFDQIEELINERADHTQPMLEAAKGLSGEEQRQAYQEVIDFLEEYGAKVSELYRQIDEIYPTMPPLSTFEPRVTLISALKEAIAEM